VNFRPPFFSLFREAPGWGILVHASPPQPNPRIFSPPVFFFFSRDSVRGLAFSPQFLRPRLFSHRKRSPPVILPRNPLPRPQFPFSLRHCFFLFFLFYSSLILVGVFGGAFFSFCALLVNFVSRPLFLFFLVPCCRLGQFPPSAPPKLCQFSVARGRLFLSFIPPSLLSRRIPRRQAVRSFRGDSAGFTRHLSPAQGVPFPSFPSWQRCWFPVQSPPSFGRPLFPRVPVVTLRMADCSPTLGFAPFRGATFPPSMWCLLPPAPRELFLPPRSFSWRSTDRLVCLLARCDY